MTRTQRLSMLGIALVVVVVGFIILRPGSGDDSSSTKTKTTTGTKPAVINVVNAKPQGGVKTVTFPKGGEVRLKINSDTADEIHIHGYDLHKDVPAGGSVSFAFPASIDGQFVVELENHKQQIASLDVTP
jgi:hypothetical protein